LTAVIIKNRGEILRVFGSRQELVGDVLELVEVAISAVEPAGLVGRKLRLSGQTLRAGEASVSLEGVRGVWVVSVGKAAPGMARGALEVLGELVERCVVVAPRGSDFSPVMGRAEMLPSSHPIPDESGLRASYTLIEMLRGASRDTLIVFLLSGGASALLPAPAEGITLEDEAETTRLLLEAGATITELNTVRKHVSAVKGGLLAKAMMPARVLSLIISDVPCDRMDVVGSGPTTPDPSTFRDAQEVLVRYGVWERAPRRVRERIERGVAGLVEETPKPGDPIFSRVTNVIIGGVGEALEAAARRAEELGYRASILSRCFEGEASSLGLFLGSVARELQRSPGTVYLAGGESTVRVVGGGRGGRNQELALAALTKMDGCRNALLAAVGTDGVDGPTDAAGAVVGEELLALAEALRIRPQDYLRANDSYTFFRLVGGHIVTGPTGTNVGDVVFIVSAKAESGPEGG